MLTDKPTATSARDTHWGDMWHYAIARMVVAARANGLRPVDGPFGDFSDADGFKAQARRAAVLGCEGKWAIHPSQIALANEVISPPEARSTRAQRILEAMDEARKEGKGAVALDGRLIDYRVDPAGRGAGEEGRADRQGGLSSDSRRGPHPACRPPSPISLRSTGEGTRGFTRFIPYGPSPVGWEKVAEGRMRASSPRLPINRRHRRRNIPLARGNTLREGRRQPPEVAHRQRDVRGLGVLFQISPPLGAGNWHDVVALRHHPGERDLRRALRPSLRPAPSTSLTSARFVSILARKRGVLRR